MRKYEVKCSTTVKMVGYNRSKIFEIVTEVSVENIFCKAFSAADILYKTLGLL